MIVFADGSLDPKAWTVFENLVCVASLPSSNDLAREVIDFYVREEQALPATVIAAEEQPAARGRGGKSWQAPAGRGIYVTVVRQVAPGEPLSVIPIAMARWTREALKHATGLEAELKWPNDLYVGRRKVAGILAEARTQGETTHLAVGIGVNVRGRGSELRVPDATTIEEATRRPASIAAVLQALITTIDRELAAPDWNREVAEWERVSLHRRGDRLTVRAEGTAVTGEYLGLDASGFLKLETPAGVAVLSTGELDDW